MFKTIHEEFVELIPAVFGVPHPRTGADRLLPVFNEPHMYDPPIVHWRMGVTPVAEFRQNRTVLVIRKICEDSERVIDIYTAQSHRSRRFTRVTEDRLIDDYLIHRGEPWHGRCFQFYHGDQPAPGH